MRNLLERRLSRWKEGSDDGFTLIELLVVLLILGILLGIAIPTFLSVTKNAGTATAESNLDTALTAVDAYYTSNGESFTGMDNPSGQVSDLSQQGAGVIWEFDASSAADNQISVSDDVTASPSQIVILTALATGNQHCYAIMDVKQPTPSTDDINLVGGTTATEVALGTPGGLTLSGNDVPAGTYYAWAAKSSTTCDAKDLITTINNGTGVSGQWEPWRSGSFPAG